MTKLEFINDRIKFYKRVIKEDEECMPQSYINEIKEKLELSEQIKTDLEAWEIIKNALELTENELGEEEIEMRVFFTNAKVECNDTRKEFKKLKKALEG